MGFTCKAVRGSSAGGGGGSLANALFHYMYVGGLYFPFRSLRTE